MVIEIGDIMSKISHYNWLETHFNPFCEKLGITSDQRGLIVAHGDKCYSYKEIKEIVIVVKN